MADELLITTPLGFMAYGHEAPGVRWTVSKLTGWIERGGVKQNREERPWGDGDFPAPTFRQARLPAWEGLCFTHSGVEQQKAQELLEAVLGNGALTRFSVQAPAGLTWADAQLDSEPTFEPVRYGEALRYRARMYVPGGYRYGEERTSASGQVAFHRGTADALPSFEVTGSMPSGYAIQSPLGTFTVTQALAAGQKHTIDFADGGLVYRNGVLQRGVYAHPRNIWAVPKGPGIEHTLVPVSGSGSLVVKVTDTF
ncbi:hypothetical protein [Microbacterium sp. KNMS]